MQTQHTNLASGYRYHGGNALILTQAANTFGYNNPQWCTKAQAEKLGRPVLPGHTGFTVMLNDRQFTVYNVDQLAAAPAPQPAPQSPPAATPAAPRATQPAQLATPSPKASTFNAFRDAMPNRAAGWPREARAFYDGLPNGGIYVAHMGQAKGELIYCALQFLAENGDAQGRRYSLKVEQIGWAFYRAIDRKGKPLKVPELATTSGMDVSPMSEAQFMACKVQGLAQPTYRMDLVPLAQAQAA